MRIPSKDVPQADILDKVVSAVQAVSSGAHSYGEIARALGEVDPRQGRYYRRAGEILGFLHNVRGQNHANLTPAGRQFIDHPEERDEILADAVLKTRLIQRVIPFFESAGERGLTRQELREFIENVTDTEGQQSTITRRVSTVVSWLMRLGMLQKINRQYVLTRALPAGVEIVQYDAPDEPLSPKLYDLAEYTNVAEKVRRAQGYINAEIDAVARERASHSHQMLINIVADKVRRAGAIPKQNPYIDLFANIDNDQYVFEVKSTKDTNVHSQIRKAISQLYEYRYIQQIPAAKLVVVIENSLPKDKTWLSDYIVNDRQLLIAWDGDRRNLSCPDQVRGQLSFLV